VWWILSFLVWRFGSKLCSSKRWILVYICTSCGRSEVECTQHLHNIRHCLQRTDHELLYIDTNNYDNSDAVTRSSVTQPGSPRILRPIRLCGATSTWHSAVSRTLAGDVVQAAPGTDGSTSFAETTTPRLLTVGDEPRHVDIGGWRYGPRRLRVNDDDDEWVIIVHCLKKRPLGVLSISLPNINRFSKFFQWHTQWTICNKVVCEYTTTP